MLACQFELLHFMGEPLAVRLEPFDGRRGTLMMLNDNPPVAVVRFVDLDGEWHEEDVEPGRVRPVL